MEAGYLGMDRVVTVARLQREARQQWVAAAADFAPKPQALCSLLNKYSPSKIFNKHQMPSLQSSGELGEEVLKKQFDG